MFPNKPLHIVYRFLKKNVVLKLIVFNYLTANQMTIGLQRFPLNISLFSLVTAYFWVTVRNKLTVAGYGHSYLL